MINPETKEGIDSRNSSYNFDNIYVADKDFDIWMEFNNKPFKHKTKAIELFIKQNFYFSWENDTVRQYNQKGKFILQYYHNRDHWDLLYYQTSEPVFIASGVPNNGKSFLILIGKYYRAKLGLKIIGN